MQKICKLKKYSIILPLSSKTFCHLMVMKEKKDIFAKSVFSDIILVQKIANFQSQSRVIDNKTLTSFVYALPSFIQREKCIL